MKVAILGSGFGLYGYLPAFVQCDATIILLERYKKKFLGRKELQGLYHKIIWCENQLEAIQNAEKIVIAKPPLIQKEFVELIFKHSNKVECVFLEKPLCVSPSESKNLLLKLERSSIKFRIAYLFIFTGWFKKIKKCIAVEENIDEIVISWSFVAYHFKNNIETWKRHHEEGGGALRFYGIHFIAVAAFLGYSYIENACLQCQESNLRIVLKKDKSPKLTFIINTQQSNSFKINFLPDNKNDNIVLKDPFDDFENNDLDYRVKILKQYINSEEDNEKVYKFYKDTINLWEKIENKLWEN